MARRTINRAKRKALIAKLARPWRKVPGMNLFTTVEVTGRLEDRFQLVKALFNFGGD